MALTIKQLESLGFKPTKKESPFKRKFDTLIYPLNETDYLYLGYNEFRKEINNKLVWKSFVEPGTKNRIAYVVTNIGSTGFTEMKTFLKRAKDNANYKPTEEEIIFLDGRDEELSIPINANLLTING